MSKVLGLREKNITNEDNFLNQKTTMTVVRATVCSTAYSEDGEKMRVPLYYVVLCVMTQRAAQQTKKDTAAQTKQ